MSNKLVKKRKIDFSAFDNTEETFRTLIELHKDFKEDVKEFVTDVIKVAGINHVSFTVMKEMIDIPDYNDLIILRGGDSQYRYQITIYIEVDEGIPDDLAVELVRKNPDREEMFDFEKKAWEYQGEIYVPGKIIQMPGELDLGVFDEEIWIMEKSIALINNIKPAVEEMFVDAIAKADLEHINFAAELDNLPFIYITGSDKNYDYNIGILVNSQGDLKLTGIARENDEVSESFDPDSLKWVPVQPIIHQ